MIYINLPYRPTKPRLTVSLHSELSLDMLPKSLQPELSEILFTWY